MMSANPGAAEGERPKKKSKNALAALLSCCLFLAIVCGCLLASLVLIGKHIVNGTPKRGVANVESPERAGDSRYSRLPNDTRPVSYDLTLRPHLESGSFEGAVDIQVNLSRSRRDIVLNSKSLTVDTVELRRINDSKVIPVENVQVRDDDQVLVVTLPEEIHPGAYNLHIKYNGSLSNKIVGFYRSRRSDNTTDVKRHIATSKFEPTYARQAYPCFDEPNLKATYKVHLLKPKDSDYIALSNYPQIEEETVEDGVLVHFDETVQMSTYLSCFIVSDFKSTVSTFDNNGVEIPFKVYASPHQLEKTTYAGEVGKKVIEYFIQYFNIAYPLPKLDMVAIPDFVSGAMEHWGLVTYRETALLYDNTTHSASNKQRVAEVVAHELAHSWFGNLVTMDWWNNLWLNEGFASYIQYKGVDSAHPDWNMMEQFQTGTMHSILSLDATQSSHPIIQTVTTPDQITEVFDSVSYNKGASVLRMLEDAVGPEGFQKGVTEYLNKHAFANAVSQDLWDAVQGVVDDSLNVTEFMGTFTVQMGYPVLEVAVDGDKFKLTQKRFLKDYESARTQERSSLGYKWDVPVRYVTDTETSGIFWFKHNENELVIDVPSGASWVKFNPNQVGYYRVNYDTSNWENLVNNIGEMSIGDKTHLLEESFAIAESGDLSYTVPLNFTKYLSSETNYVPWSVASSQLQGISKYMQTSQYDSSFKAYVVSLLKPAYDQLGWDDANAEDEHLQSLARVVILNLACVMNYDDALVRAKSLFDAWIENPTTHISPNLRSIVYKFGMTTADKATWDKLFALFASETDANEKLKLMNGLANVRDPSLLTKLIELAKDETYVRSQDYFTLLQYIAANPVGTPIVWDYVRENWRDLVDRFTLNDRYLGRLIPSITSRFLTNIKVDEMDRFFTEYPDAGAGASARLQALETVRNNIKWLQKHKEVVEEWIKNWEQSNRNA